MNTRMMKNTGELETIGIIYANIEVLHIANVI